MVSQDQVKHIGDVVIAPGLGAGSLLAQSAEVAGHLTPVLTAAMLALTCAWYIWRMVDRVRFGPAAKRGHNDDD